MAFDNLTEAEMSDLPKFLMRAQLLNSYSNTAFRSDDRRSTNCACRAAARGRRLPPGGLVVEEIIGRFTNPMRRSIGPRDF
jgi:hypothetical protein